MTNAIRPFLLLFAVVAGLWITAADAHAHGGNFRSGGGGGGLARQPIPGEDDDPPERVVTERIGWLAGDWQVWWRLNRHALLPDKRSVRRRAGGGTTGSGLFEMGDAGTAGLDAWERALRVGALDRAVPYLLELVDVRAKTRPQMVAAGLIALGRIARDKTAIKELRRYAADESRILEVRESAVLGLGLLRRSDRSEQLDAATLTSLRRFLFEIFDDKDAPTRVRAFAIIAISLLSDQPYREDAVHRDGRRVTQALWQRLQRRYPSSELQVALLTALGRQPRDGVPSGVFLGLRAIASGKPFQNRRWDGLRRSHAMAAYARLDGPAWLPMALWAMRGTHDHVAVRAASAIAVAQRAPDLDTQERFRAARSIRRSQVREPHWFVRGLGQIASAFLLREDLRRGRKELLDELKVGHYLCTQTFDGRSLTRPFSALAAGISVYDVEPRNKETAVYIKRVRKELAKGLKRGRGSDQVLGAWAVALGLSGARGALEPLLDIVNDDKRGHGLRGHAAVALAHIGLDTPEVVDALHEAARERISPDVHLRAVEALALLAPPDTTERLLRQMANTKTRGAVAVVAGAIGSFGDPSAAKRLIEMATDDERPLIVRTMCVVALGLIFDPEPRPSRVHLTTHANYPSRTSSLSQAYNIM